MSTLVSIIIQVLEAMFVVGMAGSALVIILTGVEDIETMLDIGDDESH
ncbi:MAG: hypothetical protein M3P27_12935 [Acidobacteriota bacterium]|nr:hypothetical protein [Acidobacteriota bacterium]